MAKTAILIDGGFYQKKALQLFGPKSGRERAQELIDYCYEHLKDEKGSYADELYRIFYYDCPPISKKIIHPLTKSEVDFSMTSLYTMKIDFLETMKTQRKVALRLGRLAEERAQYIIKPESVRKICDGVLRFGDLTEKDFTLDVKQKGVDMKIGIDIASISYKKQADKMILIAGDSDFVPASKLARREGIDFVLDPMWNHVNPDLAEHIDGMITRFPRPTKN